KLQLQVMRVHERVPGLAGVRERRFVLTSSAGRIALAEQHVAADLVKQRPERARFLEVEQLERVVVLSLLGQHAREARLGNQSQLWSARALVYRAQPLRGVVELAGGHVRACERKVR